MELKLQGKAALVTGSDKRTGETIADTLVAEGATVIYHGNESPPDNALGVHGDVSTEAGCEQILGQVE